MTAEIVTYTVDGRIGTIRHVRAQYLQDWIVDPAFPLVWRLQKDKGGFALFILEAATQVSPMQAAPLRRLMWPLPKGFLDQVRAVEVPVVFLVEQSLYIAQALQNALRQSGDSI